MLGFSILEPLFINVLQTKFVTGVYHSVMMKPLQEGGNKPAAPVNGRFVYVGLDDTKGFTCYCRQTGSADVSGTELVGSCNRKIYTLDIPTRLVFFNANEKRSHDEIIALLVKAVIKTNSVRLQKIINTPDEILRSEAPTGRFQFRDTTFYVAIDFFVTLDLQTDSCIDEIKCEGVPNPYCI